MQRYEKSFTFPQLVSFYFLSWQIFTSLVGKFLLPQLANAEKNAIGAKIAKKEFKVQIQSYFRNFS